LDAIHRLEYFLAVANNGGFTAAASALGTAPSAPIRAVASLEKELGVQLFRRTTRQVALTEDGRNYAMRCRSILADLAEANAQIKQSSGLISGLIRVTAPVMMGRLYVAPLLGQFLAEHPRLTINLQLSDRISDLVQDEFDLAIRVGQLKDSSLIATELGQVRKVVCAAPSYLMEMGEPSEPQDLHNHRCVHSDGYLPHNEWAFLRKGRKVLIKPNFAFHTNHLDAALQACIAGAGCGVFFSYQVRDELKAGTLIEVLRRFGTQGTPVHLVSPPGRLSSHRIKVLRNWMAKRLKGVLSK
jgi:DNA-binding transcriptional LysR family regulator